MLNVRCTANKYTRNLGIRIRTFCVIPLQEKGGIIEWVPNVTTFGDFVQQGGCTKRSEAEALKGQMRNIVNILSYSFDYCYDFRILIPKRSLKITKKLLVYTSC